MSDSYSKLMKRPHLGASRMLGYALTAHDYETWESASAVWQARLTPEENAALAWAAMKALDADQGLMVAETVLTGAGMPLPTFFRPMSDAAFWASIANPDEIDAYALACVRAMAPHRQTAFLDYMKEQVAA
jgi:hypothetical protein